MKVSSVNFLNFNNKVNERKQLSALSFQARKHKCPINDEFCPTCNNSLTIEKRKMRCKRISFAPEKMPSVNDILDKIYNKCCFTETLTEKANNNNYMTEKMEVAYFDNQDNLLALVTKINSPNLEKCTIIRTPNADYIDLDGDGYIETKSVDKVFYEIKSAQGTNFFNTSKEAKAFLKNIK